MSRTRGSKFAISDSRIPDFRYSLKKILSALPPIGMRGNYNFEKKFKDYDKSEFFYFKYALINYILDEERVGSSLQKTFKNDVDIMLSEFTRTDKSIKKNEINKRLKYYDDKLPRIFGKNRFKESSELENEFYQHIYRYLFENKYINRSEEEWKQWFLTNEDKLEIIPQFIVWYHEAVLIVLTLYDESLWLEHR